MYTTVDQMEGRHGSRHEYDNPVKVKLYSSEECPQDTGVVQNRVRSILVLELF